MVFHYPVDRNQIFTKRIVGMPGDRIRLSHKVLYRNGVAQNEPWVTHKLDYEDQYRDNFPNEPNALIFPTAQLMLAKSVVGGEVVVPPGMYFVMGDNRDQSLDSRYWGFVSERDFIGKPLFVYDSVDENKHHRWDRLFRPL
jgi:signal peptidase I